MTRLLVSVRNAEEAAAAIAGGADLIDVKEPNAGSLGAASSEAIAEVLDVVAGRRPASVALGELIDASKNVDAMIDRLPPERLPQFAKVGLAGCAAVSNWPDRWSRALATLPVGISPVAVVYADWKIAAAPRPEDVLRHGERIGCGALLIDTYDKRGPGLVGVWGIDELRCFVDRVRSAGLTIVLGGQIKLYQCERLLALAPDYLAVRGAVCRGDRAGELDPQLVAEFARAMKTASTGHLARPRASTLKSRA